MTRDIDLITTHINSDFDALASMLAVSKLYPEALLVFPGSQERNLRNFFVESVCYFYNFAKLKDVPLDRVKRLIVVDTRQAGRLGPLSALASSPEVEIIAYDHHPDSLDDIKTSWQLVEPFGSTTAIIGRLLEEQGIELSPDEATLMALGIYEDTGNFTFISTTPQDMKVAAWLLHQGANLNIISSMITRDFTADEMGILKDMITSSELIEVQGINISIAAISRDSYVPDLASLVQKVMDGANMDVFITLARMEDKIYLVARSRLPQVDVGRLARIVGGGGHPSAASATLREVSLESAHDNLIKLLKDNIRPRYLARDLMTSPVITLQPGVSISEAHDMFLRYQINVMPIVEDDQVLGIITNRTVERALNHDLGPLPVSEYMDAAVESIGPDATLAEVEYRIVQQRMRLLPIIENNHLVGIITRTDLLQHLLDNPELPEYSPYAIEELDGARFRNVQKLLNERLSKEIRTILQQIGRLAEDTGATVYLVGGSVRDILLRRDNLDLDVVIEGDAIELGRKYVEHNSRAILKENPKFATAKLVFDDGLVIDLASARLEYYQSPAALPEVTMSSIKLDLYRRDFTINTLAIHLNPGQYGTLIDFFDGLHDIKEGIIRVLHNLSFVEDPTRIFRAVRFEERLGFKLAKQTESLIKNVVKLDVLHNLSPDRLGHELKTILNLEEPTACLMRLNSLKLLKFVHPELKINPQQRDLLLSQEEVLSWYNLSFLETPVKNWVYYSIGLFSPLDDDELSEATRRLNLAPRILEEILATRRQANMVFYQLQRSPTIRASRIYMLLKDLKLENQLFIMAASKQEEAKKAVSSYLTSWRKVKTEITGYYLQTMGFAPGPQLGAIKKRLLAARLDGQVHNLDEERALVLKEFSGVLNNDNKSFIGQGI